MFTGNYGYQCHGLLRALAGFKFLTFAAVEGGVAVYPHFPVGRLFQNGVWVLYGVSGIPSLATHIFFPFNLTGNSFYAATPSDGKAHTNVVFNADDMGTGMGYWFGSGTYNKQYVRCIQD